MPKVLWMSPYSLHDTSSGASIAAKQMLESLVKHGYEVWSCATFVFDTPAGTSAFGDLDKTLETNKNRVFVMDDKGIHYIYVRNKHRDEMSLSMAESQLLYETYLDVLDEFKPDIVFGYCPGMVSIACFSEAQRRGIKTVYFLVNGNHGHFAFNYYDLVITDSRATSQLYAARDNINVVPIGCPFELSRIVAKERDPKYVTFINPSGAKGVSIFAKLAKACEKEMPDLRFLVVNSRGNFSQIAPLLHEQGKPDVHPYANCAFPNVDMTGIQNDMRPVFAITKALLVPSLWYESWGRVSTEAVFNNIPVLCSNSGGIPEAMGGSGVIIEAPKHCQEDFFSLPTDEEIKPWVEGLKTVLSTDYSEQFAKTQQQHTMENCTRRVMEAFAPLLLPHATNRPHYYR